jgi:hypothetical protein
MLKTTTGSARRESVVPPRGTPAERRYDGRLLDAIVRIRIGVAAAWLTLTRLISALLLVLVLLFLLNLLVLVPLIAHEYSP